MKHASKNRNVNDRIRYIAIVLARFMNLTWLAVAVSATIMPGRW